MSERPLLPVDDAIAVILGHAAPLPYETVPLADALGRLIRGEMADAGQHFELVGRGDEIDRAFGGDAADGVVGVAPDVERRRANGT